MAPNSLCRVELFGGLRVLQGERVITRFPTRKVASLLAYLAYYSQQAHPREVLIDLFWQESALQAGRASLSQALSTLRRHSRCPGREPPHHHQYGSAPEPRGSDHRRRRF